MTERLEERREPDPPDKQDESWQDGLQRKEEVQRLFKERPRSLFLRCSLAIIAFLIAGSWLSGELVIGDLLSTRRLANLERFLGELRPFPLQGKPFDLAVAIDWCRDILQERGLQAARTTLALSVASIVLAAMGALLLAPTAARTLATPEPYLPGPSAARTMRRGAWRVVVGISRLALVLTRSIPEYVLAFLFLAIFGPSAWPVVLALALHNTGIIGKLMAEVIENLNLEALAAWRGNGAGRRQILLFAIGPLTLPRFLLFFFYRWETCVREATVLGMLGVVSLGYWIVDARARNHYDDMLLLILVGAALVLLGDLVSALTRELVRRAT